MTEKIYQSDFWAIAFTISDKEWETLEKASGKGFKFSEVHRQAIESAVSEYVMQRGALSRAAYPAQVKDVINRLRDAADHLFIEMLFLRCGARSCKFA